MIPGIKQNTPSIIKSLPERKIHADWLKNEIIGCLKVLIDCGFKVRMIISDNHPCNTSAYHKILNHFNTPCDNLYFMYESQKIYLCFNTVYLIKSMNIIYKITDASSFQHLLLRNLITLMNLIEKVGKYRNYYMTLTKKTTLQANLRKASRSNVKEFHPGNNKGSVPIALAIINETTTAATESHFPEKNNSADFLRLLNICWIISNSKTQFHPNNPLGSAAKIGDNKSEFLRSFAACVAKW